MSRQQYGLNISPQVGLNPNDPMVPEAKAYNDALNSLNANYMQSLNNGSFTAQHPILSPLLRALGGAAVGGLAGGGRGAVLGALTLGGSAFQNENSRLEKLAAAYQQQAKNILANQQTFNGIKKDRTAAQVAGNLFKANGKDPSVVQDPSGVALSGLDVGLLGRLIEGQQGINGVNAIGPMFSQAQQAGINTGNQVMNPPARPQLPQQVTQGMQRYKMGQNGQPQSNMPEPMPLPAMPNGSSPEMLQGSVQGSPLSPVGFGYSPSIVNALASGAARLQATGAELPIKAFDARSKNDYRDAQATVFPSVIGRNNALASIAPSQIAENYAGANLKNRTNPNLRSGGGNPDPNYGKQSAEMKNLIDIISAANNKNASPELQAAGAAAVQQFNRLANISLVQPPAAPKGPNLVESLLGGLGALGPKKDTGRFAKSGGR